MYDKVVNPMRAPLLALVLLPASLLSAQTAAPPASSYDDAKDV